MVATEAERAAEAKAVGLEAEAMVGMVATTVVGRAGSG